MINYVERQMIKVNVQGKDYDMTYMELNQSSKKDLIVSHGSFYNANGMLDLAKYFKEDYHVIVPDLPGHYNKPDQAVDNFDLFVEIYKTFIEALVSNGVIKEKPYMAGWSLGGSLTLALATKGVLGKAIILDGDSKWTEGTIPPFDNDDALYQGVYNLLEAASVGADPEYTKVLQNDMPEYLVDYQTANKDLTMDYALDIREELKKIDVPVILVLGTLDFLTVISKQQELEAAIKDTTLIVIEGGTHMVCADRPEVVAKELLNVL